MQRQQSRSRSPRRTARSSKKPRLKSKFEAKVYDTFKEKGIAVEYEADSLRCSLHLTYKPDWKVREGLFIESKGLFDYVERRKILAVRSANPDKEIRMVFMRNNKIRKGSDTTYGDWCDQNGIKWSVYPELPL